MKLSDLAKPSATALPSAFAVLRTEKRSIMMGFTVPAATADRIEKIAKLQGYTKSEWCARAVIAALNYR